MSVCMCLLRHCVRERCEFENSSSPASLNPGKTGKCVPVTGSIVLVPCFVPVQIILSRSATGTIIDVSLDRENLSMQIRRSRQTSVSESAPEKSRNQRFLTELIQLQKRHT